MSVRTEPSILWREGLFLCPQHMQSQAREVQARIHAAEEMGSPGSYGLLSLEVDEETGAFLTGRLEHAGASSAQHALFDAETVGEIRTRSGGLPGIAQHLADTRIRGAAGPLLVVSQGVR